MTAQERFDELVSEYLDEALDDEGMTELSTLLATRAQYAARFVMLSRLHGGLRELQGPRPAPRDPPRRILWAVVIAVLAAALLLVFLGLRHFSRRGVDAQAPGRGCSFEGEPPGARA